MTQKKIEKNIDTIQFKEFVDEFKNETDRAAVVLGAAKLDQLLYRMIQAFLIPSTTSKDELLDGDSPLGTFSSKINLAFRCGLIDSNLTRALHMVRKIRNSFAHEVSGCSLTNGAHSDRVKELAHPLKQFKIYSQLEELFFGDQKGTNIDFRTTLAIMVARLEKGLKLVKTIRADNQIELIRTEWELDK